MPEHARYSLLDEQLLRVRDPGGRVRPETLPGILARLVTDDVASFEALQAHQRQPWYCFLVQLAAMAVARAGKADPPAAPGPWRDLLLNLTDGAEEPWCLVVSDLELPAFMQPPVPEGSLEDAKFKVDVDTPDDLDMLVTSKNHDVKMRRVGNPQVELWVYALLTTQTLEGFLGRGNYGIARMNGGFGNRPFVGLSPGLSWSQRFLRDIFVLLKGRENLAEQFQYDRDGHALLWLVPWNGEKSNAIPLSDCDPLLKCVVASASRTEKA